MDVKNLLWTIYRAVKITTLLQGDEISPSLKKIIVTYNDLLDVQSINNTMQTEHIQ